MKKKINYKININLKHKKYNKIFVGLFTILILCVSTFNYIIDPYSIFETKLIKRINKNKPELKKQERVTKIINLKLDPTKYETILVGSSRIGYALDPTYYNKVTNNNAQNLGVFGSDIIESIELAKTTLKIHPEIKKIFLGLDFYGFNDAKRDKVVINKNKKLTLTELSSVLISYSATTSSFNTLKSNLNNNAPIFEANGLFYDRYIPCFQQYFMKILNDFKRDEKFYKNYKPSNYKYDKLNDFVKFCQKEDIELILFTNPIHTSMFQVMITVGAFEEFKNWKCKLAKISKYRDFCYVNHVTAEIFNEDMDYFFDPSHYKKATGNIILDSLINNDNSISYIATKDNIIEKNIKLEKDFFLWQQNNSELVKKIKGFKN